MKMGKKPETVITVKTEGNEPYDILLRESFGALEESMRNLGCEGHRICIVTDSNVAPLFLEEVKAIAEAIDADHVLVEGDLRREIAMNIKRLQEIG